MTFRSLAEQQGPPLLSSMEYFFGVTRDVGCTEHHSAQLRVCSSPPDSCRVALDFALKRTQHYDSANFALAVPPDPQSLPVVSSYAQLLGSAPPEVAPGQPPPEEPPQNQQYCLLEATQYPRLTRWQNITFLTDAVCGNLTMKSKHTGEQFPRCENECHEPPRWSVYQDCIDGADGDACELQNVCQPSARALTHTVQNGYGEKVWGDCGISQDACGGLVARVRPAFIATFASSNIQQPSVFVTSNGHVYTPEVYYNPPNPCSKYERALSEYAVDVNSTMAQLNQYDTIYVISQYYTGVYEMMAQTLPRLMWGWSFLRNNPSIKIHATFPQALAVWFIDTAFVVKRAVQDLKICLRYAAYVHSIHGSARNT
eukprot:scaffold439_cov415-Prasinococcus_capsulatus_cf.AAC.4